MRFKSFGNFVPQHAFKSYCCRKTQLFVKRDHGPPEEGAASFHTTRWTIVMRAAQSQAQGGQSALAEIDEEIDAFCDAPVASGGKLGP